ncbi:unnamed protein product [Leptidea sinapis]|uniref:DDT domain-containing protein n=1 Tax=Leptidea sinapis TaxID=189913 RepID=A0A5E4QDD4_9NEOP|nr:unnamed protein product [Leptidea sinapis]
MDKESGDGGDSTAKPPPDPLLDPSSLFGGAAWWSMASHLAAQDYLARLQASGLNFPQLGDPYAALSALSGSSMKQPKQPKQPRKSSSGKEKERDMSVLRSELMLAQAAAQGAYHAAVAAAAKGKNLPMYPFSMGSEKDRRGGIDSLTGLPHNLLSDPAAVLGGVRLPPDTEIIKYTSSLTGPKVPTSSTNRGRKKTISLDPPHVSLHPSSELPSKRQKLYGNSRSSVEVIRLPNKPDRGSSISGTPPPNLSDYAAVSQWPSREGRPRNLGRGVSKPKKNTVASLLAQSRALGLRPALEEAKALAALAGPRSTPPLERRIELARRQQAARDARRDASARNRDQVRLVRELERSEKAEYVKREKEVRSQQILEHINRNRSQLTIEAVPVRNEWKVPEALTKPKDRTMPQISLSLIPVSGKDAPIKTLNYEQGTWTQEYNALDKMKDFAEKAAFDLPKAKADKNYDFSLTKAAEKAQKIPEGENNLEKLIESYSRISEFINGCDWSKLVNEKKVDDAKALEQKYLDAKNEFMTQNLMLMPKDNKKSVLREVIDLSTEDENILSEINRKISQGMLRIGKDGALSITVQTVGDLSPAKRKKQEEVDKQKNEDHAKRQQEREIKRHQAMLLKEQKPLPTLERIPGLKLAGQAFADLLQTFEFLHNFGNSLGFVVDSLPSLDTLQQGLLPDYNNEAEDELVLLTIRLLEIALEDPGIPHPGRHTTLLGQAIRIGDITPDNLKTLRDKPFVSLNPTSKARILATLCDELLQNKSVLRQIDASLDHLNHLRKEKYLMDAKFRNEKQQALALERMQRLVEESVVTRSPLHESSDKSQTPKKESSPEKPNTPSPYKDSEDQSDKELSPLKDLSNSMKSKEMLNNNKDECPVEGKDKDSVMGDNDGIGGATGRWVKPVVSGLKPWSLLNRRYSAITPD